MAILDKLMFWKKKDALGDFGKDLDMKGFDTGLPPGGADTGMKGLGQGNDNLGMPGANKGLEGAGDLGLPGMDKGPSGNFPIDRPQAPTGNMVPMQQPFQNQPAPIAPAPKEHEYMVSKDIEIISSKLDALRAAIESVNQRLANIERIAMGEQEKNNRW